MEDSIFTKIIKKEIPCHKVYEDEKTIAFLPLRPIALGHVLVVPKIQVDQFYDLPGEDYRALMQTVKKVAIRMNYILKPKRIGLQVVGLDVPHAHVHVIAFDTLSQYSQSEKEALDRTREELAEMAKKLAC